MACKNCLHAITTVDECDQHTSSAITTNPEESVMNKNTVSDYLPLINHQIIVHEALLEYHRKADAMLKVLLKSNIANDAISTIHDYLFGVHDNIAWAKRLNERLLNDLMKIVKHAERSKRTLKGDCHACC